VLPPIFAFLGAMTFGPSVALMAKWDIPRHEERMAEIRRELGKFLTLQTEFFRKRTHTTEDLREYQDSRQQVRELFDELEQLRKAT
jgi:hypothetical protein